MRGIETSWELWCYTGYGVDYRNVRVTSDRREKAALSTCDTVYPERLLTANTFISPHWIPIIIHSPHSWNEELLCVSFIRSTFSVAQAINICTKRDASDCAACAVQVPQPHCEQWNGGKRCAKSNILKSPALFVCCYIMVIKTGQLHQRIGEYEREREILLHLSLCSLERANLTKTQRRTQR